MACRTHTYDPLYVTAYPYFRCRSCDQYAHNATCFDGTRLECVCGLEDIDAWEQQMGTPR